MVSREEVPKILLHATLYSRFESIKSKGLLPGGLNGTRVDSYFVDAIAFGQKLIKGKPREAREPIWADPVFEMHMRVQSGIALMFSGELVIYSGVVIYKSEATGDYSTKNTVPPHCMIGARSR